MTAPLPTRAEEGHETDDRALSKALDAAYHEARDLADRAGVSWLNAKRIADVYYGPAVRNDVVQIETLRARAVQAGAEVARLTAALKASDERAREVMLACLRAFRTSVMNDNTMPFSAFCTLVDDRMCEAARTALEAPHADN